VAWLLKNWLNKKKNEKYDLEAICDELVTRCIKELGSSDNCTLIIVLFK